MGMVDGCIRLLSMFLFGVTVTEKQQALSLSRAKLCIGIWLGGLARRRRINQDLGLNFEVCTDTD